VGAANVERPKDAADVAKFDLATTMFANTGHIASASFSTRTFARRAGDRKARPFAGAIRFANAPYVSLPRRLPQRLSDPLLPARPVGLEKIQHVAVEAQRIVPS
jgi:hypothetical protein